MFDGERNCLGLKPKFHHLLVHGMSRSYLWKHITLVLEKCCWDNDFDLFFIGWCSFLYFLWLCFWVFDVISLKKKKVNDFESSSCFWILCTSYLDFWIVWCPLFSFYEYVSGFRRLPYLISYNFAAVYNFLMRLFLFIGNTDWSSLLQSI